MLASFDANQQVALVRQFALISQVTVGMDKTLNP